MGLYENVYVFITRHIFIDWFDSNPFRKSMQTAIAWVILCLYLYADRERNSSSSSSRKKEFIFCFTCWNIQMNGWSEATRKAENQKKKFHRKGCLPYTYTVHFLLLLFCFKDGHYTYGVHAVSKATSEDRHTCVIIACVLECHRHGRLWNAYIHLCVERRVYKCYFFLFRFISSSAWRTASLSPFLIFSLSLSLRLRLHIHTFIIYIIYGT